MALKPKIDTHVSLQPIPRAIVRTARAGELVKTMGGTDAAIRVAQDGVASGLVQTIEVYGLDSTGCQRERVVLTFDEDASGDILIDTSNGRSVTEATDAGMAKAVAFAKRQFEKLGLATETRFSYTPKVWADEALLAETRRRLGTGPGEPISVSEGMVEREYLNLRPGKDKGSMMSMSTTRRA